MRIKIERAWPALAALALACTLGSALAQAPGKHKLPAGEPCTVVPHADLQKAFPGVKAGVRDRRLEEYGSTQCAWSDSRGQVVFGFQESYGSNSAMEEALRKGEHTLVLMSPELPKRDRAAALKVYEDLGRLAAKRLD
jgi:hypothetical protein